MSDEAFLRAMHIKPDETPMLDSGTGNLRVLKAPGIYLQCSTTEQAAALSNVLLQMRDSGVYETVARITAERNAAIAQRNHHERAAIWWARWCWGAWITAVSALLALGVLIHA